MARFTLKLEGLGCANCAAKMEAAAAQVPGVSQAQMVFATQEMRVEIHEDSLKPQIIDQISRIVSQIEPETRVVELSQMHKAEGALESGSYLKRQLRFLVPGLMLYAVGLLLSMPQGLEYLFYICSYLLFGWDVLLTAGRNIKKGQVFDENFLMTVATLGAFAIGDLPEASAVMLLYKVGEIFQDMAVNNSRRSIRSLINIRPDWANLKTPQGMEKVRPENVAVGDVILVLPGEKIPLDGMVLEGYSTADTSALTGESLPRDISPGDNIMSGFVNQSGMLTVQVTKSFDQSAASRIIELVQNAAARKAPTENFITRFARVYTPAVVSVAALIALLPPLLTGSLDFPGWGYRALIFLVVSCPCALIISIPLSYFGGIGAASRSGILVKGGNYLEALYKVETVVFDKTGTLTKGVFRVAGLYPADGFSEASLLEAAAYAESHSTHPIARSILEYYGKPVDNSTVESVREHAGHGITAVVNGDTILAGNAGLLLEGNINAAALPGASGSTDGTIVYVAVNGVYRGHIRIEDQVKVDSAQAIAGLRSLGVKRVAMLTGDVRHTAEEIAARLGINEVYAGLLPDQKVEKLELLKKQSQGGKLVFAGDGINDAPVLAMADVGVAMGALGSDAAIEAADVVLMTDEPAKLCQAIQIARRTRKIVWQNIVFSLGVKLVVLSLGAAGAATMWEAVFADVGVALVAVLNSLRVMKQAK